MAKSMMTVRVRPSLDKKIEALKENLGATTRQVFTEMASRAVSLTPVDTGAAVTSFSIKDKRSSGRSRSSKGKPRRQNKQKMRAIGFKQMLEDLAKIDFRSVKTVTLSNSAPHWLYFNSKGITGRKIFELLAAEFRNRKYTLRGDK